ncbi:hypothetical protein PAEPH01_0946 [Pancytospora epiphaga]|nr:hypothetical protein PAEPH01_0946 [Pancytospora epiphaga]
MSEQVTECKKRCIAIMVGSCVITAFGMTFQIRQIVPKLCSTHEKLHLLERSKKCLKSEIYNYLKNPYSITKLSGSKKINLFLLIFFIKKKPFKPTEQMTKKQQKLFNLLVYNKEEWTNLMYEDLDTFIRLQQHLGTRISKMVELDYEDMLLLHFMDIEEYRIRDYYNILIGKKPDLASSEYLELLENERKKIHRVLSVYKLHKELCIKEVDTGYQEYLEFEHDLKQYNKVIKAIKKGRAPNIICPSLSSYRCVAMINEWVILNGDDRFYNFKLLNLENMTENERLVRDFVLKHMRSRDKAKRNKLVDDY